MIKIFFIFYYSWLLLLKILFTNLWFINLVFLLFKNIIISDYVLLLFKILLI